MTAEAVARPVPPPAAVTCACGFVVFDGLVTRGRVLRLVARRGNPYAGAEVKCRCKRWVGVPLGFSPL